MLQDTSQGVIFPELMRKPIEAHFDLPSVTSDGGAVLLGAADRSLGLSDALSRCLQDSRDVQRVRHGLGEMLRQRMFSIACGYEDANDAAYLKGDPMQQSLVAPLAREGKELASQPTLSRFENSVSRTTCYRIGDALMNIVLQRHQKRLRRVNQVTIDLDGSVDPTHGGQQLSLFSGFYDTHCYLPLFGFLSFNEESDQHLFAAVLRPGTIDERQGSIGVLRRVLDQVRARFPRANIRVRLDGGFAGPEIFEFLEKQRVEYVVAMAKNSVLVARSTVSMCLARVASEILDSSVKFYGDTRYAARSWGGIERRVIYKAEVLRSPGVLPKDNARFVVTNLRHKPETVYDIYKGRGDAENRIKELKDGLQIDRTSCHAFWANQFRVLITAASYVLFQEIRLRAHRTSLARAQVGTLRLALIKIGALIQRSCRRVSIRLSQHHPWQREWLMIAQSLGAIPPPRHSTG